MVWRMGAGSLTLREGSFGVGLWKDIGKEVTQIRQNCSFKVGNGCKVRFWEDVWCGEASFCSSFPSLYEVASSKGDMVADLLEINGTEGGWNFRFERHLNDWELEEAQRFICTVSTKSLNPLSVNRIWWNGENDGMFSVKSSYDLYDGGRPHLVPVNMIWNPIVPTKVGFFVWEVWWRKILTMDQLKKHDFSLASRCPFCGQKEEALEHLFIHYSKIWDLWTTLFSLSDGGWVCPYLVKDLLMGWVRLPLKKKEAKLWRALPLCLLWAIWMERNKVVFEDLQFSRDRLNSFFLRYFREWAIMIPDVNLSFLRGVLGSM